jgi:hypothetical protein
MAILREADIDEAVLELQRDRHAQIIERNRTRADVGLNAVKHEQADCERPGAELTDLDLLHGGAIDPRLWDRRPQKPLPYVVAGRAARPLDRAAILSRRSTVPRGALQTCQRSTRDEGRRSQLAVHAT